MKDFYSALEALVCEAMTVPAAERRWVARTLRTVRGIIPSPLRWTFAAWADVLDEIDKAMPKQPDGQMPLVRVLTGKEKDDG